MQFSVHLFKPGQEMEVKGGYHVRNKMKNRCTKLTYCNARQWSCYVCIRNRLEAIVNIKRINSKYHKENIKTLKNKFHNILVSKHYTNAIALG